MIRFTVKIFYSFSFLILLVFFVSSCRKFDGDITVPAYLRIDSLFLNTDIQVQGSESHKITTAFIYVDDKAVGIYELPTVAPVLVEGAHKVRIDAGINMDGIKSLRVYYPFYEAIIQDIDFKALDTILLNSSSYSSSTGYWDNTEFLWMIDFEDPSYNLDSIQPSTINIERTAKDDPNAYLLYDSHYSGVLKLTSGKNYFRISSNVNSGDGFPLERLNNIPIFLELNFKCNHIFSVGVFANGLTTVEAKPVLIMNESLEWNKIYVNLKPVVDASIEAVNFNIYFEGGHESGVDTTWVYLDNIKLITR
ncbi:hypothetical protein ACFLRY_01130 [Bacteroidota bacterium]